MWWAKQILKLSPNRASAVAKGRDWEGVAWKSPFLMVEWHHTLALVMAHMDQTENNCTDTCNINPYAHPLMHTPTCTIYVNTHKHRGDACVQQAH